MPTTNTMTQNRVTKKQLQYLHVLMKYLFSVICYVFFGHPLRSVKIYVVYLQALSVVLQSIKTFYVRTSTTNYSDTRSHTYGRMAIQTSVGTLLYPEFGLLAYNGLAFLSNTEELSGSVNFLWRLVYSKELEISIGY